MKMSKIKINSDMESTIVASLMSLVDDRPNEIKHCGPNEDEEIKQEDMLATSHNFYFDYFMILLICFKVDE